MAYVTRGKQRIQLPIVIADASTRDVDAAWSEFDAEIADKELKLAGWVRLRGSIYQSPRGNMWLGPALAWKMLRKYGTRC